MSVFLPAPLTIVVFSLSTVTFLARPSILIVTFSSLIPRSAETMVPPLRIAISSSIALRRSRRRGSSRGSEEELQEGDLERGDRAGRYNFGQWRRRDRPLYCRRHEESWQRGGYHRRRGEVARDRTRGGRRYAVRPRLHLALLHHQRRQDAG